MNGKFWVQMLLLSLSPSISVETYRKRSPRGPPGHGGHMMGEGPQMGTKATWDLRVRGCLLLVEGHPLHLTLPTVE